MTGEVALDTLGGFDEERHFYAAKGLLPSPDLTLEREL